MPDWVQVHHRRHLAGGGGRERLYAGEPRQFDAARVGGAAALPGIRHRSDLVRGSAGVGGKLSDILYVVSHGTLEKEKLDRAVRVLHPDGKQEKLSIFLKRMDVANMEE